MVNTEYPAHPELLMFSPSFLGPSSWDNPGWLPQLKPGKQIAPLSKAGTEKRGEKEKELMLVTDQHDNRKRGRAETGDVKRGI